MDGVNPAEEDSAHTTPRREAERATEASPSRAMAEGAGLERLEAMMNAMMQQMAGFRHDLDNLRTDQAELRERVVHRSASSSPRRRPEQPMGSVPAGLTTNQVPNPRNNEPILRFPTEYHPPRANPQGPAVNNAERRTGAVRYVGEEDWQAPDEHEPVRDEVERVMGYRYEEIPQQGFRPELRRTRDGDEVIRGRTTRLDFPTFSGGDPSELIFRVE